MGEKVILGGVSFGPMPTGAAYAGATDGCGTVAVSTGSLMRERDDAIKRIASFEAALPVFASLVDRIAHEVSDDNEVEADHTEIVGVVDQMRELLRALRETNSIEGGHGR